ncbi:hypothetical protein EB155_14440, partial [archaeon]|nr:hypothetical protein [archaeon]
IKIRMLDTINDTFDIIHLAALSGIKAVTIHGRRIHDRPRHIPLYNEVKELVLKLRKHNDTKHLTVEGYFKFGEYLKDKI